MKWPHPRKLDIIRYAQCGEYEMARSLIVNALQPRHIWSAWLSDEQIAAIDALPPWPTTADAKPRMARTETPEQSRRSKKSPVAAPETQVALEFV